VQIALGDLREPASFRNALRGVETVVHLAGTAHDQPRTSIEEVNAVATLRLLRAAEHAGARRFLVFSALDAHLHSRARFYRSKALARSAVERSPLETTVFSPSIIYAPGDKWLTTIERFSYLPALPVAGSGRALYQPIWADDAADCVVAALRETPDGDGASGDGGGRAYELAGPETLSYRQMLETVLRASGRARPLIHLPLPFVRGFLTALGRVVGPQAFASWDEAQVLSEPMITPRGTADVEALGVRPQPMSAVLGGVPPG
jgi:NADH dehydrogenase